MVKTGYIAVTDIHACPDQLADILQQSRAWPGHQLVFLGDYLDRGPDNEGVIAQLRNLPAVFLLGNHEEVFLRRWNRDDSIEQAKLKKFTGLSDASIVWMREKLAEQARADLLFTRRFADYSGFTAKTVVHGHHVVPEPEVRGNRININTGCGSAGRLSALVLPEMQFLHSAPSPGKAIDWTLLREALMEDWELGVLEEL